MRAHGELVGFVNVNEGEFMAFLNSKNWSRIPVDMPNLISSIVYIIDDTIRRG